jgi:hypothetical protein
MLKWLKGREKSLEVGKEGSPAKRQKLVFDTSDFVNSLLQLNTQFSLCPSKSD